MSQENRTPDYRHFDRMMRDAYLNFLAYEDSTLHASNEPAVRAGRFNQYVSVNYPILKNSITPDICETYLERYKYIKGPIGDGPDEPFNEAQRLLEAIKAYREFKSDIGFKGSKEAEMLAFCDYVSMKHANTLPDFSEEDARQAMEGLSSKRKTGALKWMMGLVCSAVLAGVMIPAMKEDDEIAPRKPATPSKRSYDNRYQAPYQPLTSPKDLPVLPPGMYQQPYYAPDAFPTIGPVPRQPGMEGVQPRRPSWQERYSANEHDDKDGPSERKR